MNSRGEMSIPTDLGTGVTPATALPPSSNPKNSRISLVYRLAAVSGVSLPNVRCTLRPWMCAG
jgi:hypothetical protein